MKKHGKTDLTSARCFQVDFPNDEQYLKAIVKTFVETFCAKIQGRGFAGFTLQRKIAKFYLVSGAPVVWSEIRGAFHLLELTGKIIAEAVILTMK